MQLWSSYVLNLLIFVWYLQFFIDSHNRSKAVLNVGCNLYIYI